MLLNSARRFSVFEPAYNICADDLCLCVFDLLSFLMLPRLSDCIAATNIYCFLRCLFIINGVLIIAGLLISLPNY